jgi:hypothetical protein
MNDEYEKTTNDLTNFIFSRTIDIRFDVQSLLRVFLPVTSAKFL